MDMMWIWLFLTQSAPGFTNFSQVYTALPIFIYTLVKCTCRQSGRGSRSADREKEEAGLQTERDKRRQSSVTFGGEENKKKCMKGNCRWVKVVLTDLMEGDAFTPGEEATATKRMFWLKRSDLHGVARQPEVCTLSQSQHLFSPLSPYNRCLPELERRSEGG